MYSYLALGDSYTIGEQVAMKDNFPHQTQKLLNEQGLQVSEPVIVAQTGWTTDELAAAIRESNITGEYSFVTLLIGVNNQYRNRSVENYKEEYEALLKQAIAYAGGDETHVFVLSIPDWGVTPFAEGRDREAIAKAIDEYNDAKKAITEEYGCHYLDITPSTRANGTDEAYLVGDKLHYSDKEYAVWSKELADMIVEEFKH